MTTELIINGNIIQIDTYPVEFIDHVTGADSIRYVSTTTTNQPQYASTGDSVSEAEANLTLKLLNP